MPYQMPETSNQPPRSKAPKESPFSIKEIPLLHLILGILLGCLLIGAIYFIINSYGLKIINLESHPFVGILFITIVVIFLMYRKATNPKAKPFLVEGIPRLHIFLGLLVFMVIYAIVSSLTGFKISEDSSRAFFLVSITIITLIFVIYKKIRKPKEKPLKPKL